jgi:hypothetical protein
VKLVLQRCTPGALATEGRLSIDGLDFCATLEPAVPIQAGTYGVLLYHSPRFGTDVPWLQGVPGHTFIEMHVGNSDRDTHDCILVALDGGKPDDDWIARSRPAFDALVAKCRAAAAISAPITITILDVSDQEATP